MNLDEDVLPTSSSESVEVREKSKECRVCGKPAAGIHYGVQACHGCKSFFRRATLKNIRYPECSLNKTCYSVVGPGVAPTKCHKCRVKKCYSVGMVSHVIPRKPISSSTNISSASCQLSLQKMITKEEAMCDLIDQLSHLDLQIDMFRKSAYNPAFPPKLEEIVLASPQLSLAQKYGPMMGWPLTAEEYLKKRSQVQERVITKNFEEVGTIMVNKTLNFDSNIKTWLVFDIITEIEYAKTFDFFHRLSHSDKLALIQETTIMNMYLTAAFHSLSQNFDEIHKPDGVPTSAVISTAANKNFAMQELKMAQRTLGPMIRENIDRQEYLLLKAVTLCNNAASGLSPHGQKIVERERHKYSSALFCYCRTRFGVLIGPARFYTILSMIGGLVKTQNDFRSLVLLVPMFIRDKLNKRDENFVMPRLLQHELLKI